jgi:hemerythrin
VGSFGECWLGHEPFDSQHKLLFEIAGELRGALDAGAGDAVVGDCLERLLAYMAFHFATEDRLMRETDYPGIAGHRQEHDSALASVRRLESAYRAGQESMAEETMRFVELWATEHIPRADRALAEHVESTSRR